MHIAIAGCGQLSRMLALAGIPMGFKFSFIADAEEDTRCVAGLGEIVRWQSGDSTSELYQALGKPERITVEKEQIDVTLLEALQSFCPVYPNAEAFSFCQHRYREKQLLDELGIPCAPYIYGQPEESELPLPVVVKSCRDGYDGKNQWVLKTQQDVESFSPEAREDRYVVEQFIPFDREVSQVSVRGVDGEIRHYPLAENLHQQGILKRSIAPAKGTSAELQAAAQDYMRKLMEKLDYVGVMAMECFVVKDRLLVNELAPRVHNSGHWTQSGGATCQFENHVRAVSGAPLGSTKSLSITGMVNLIGIDEPELSLLTAQSRIHWYDKVVRPGRKLGHINIVCDSYDDLNQQIKHFESVVY